jgi:hypothetical protein
MDIILFRYSLPIIDATAPVSAIANGYSVERYDSFTPTKLVKNVSSPPSVLPFWLPSGEEASWFFLFPRVMRS